MTFDESKLKIESNKKGKRMLTTSQIQQTLKANLPMLTQKYPLSKMAIFGSYARNEQTENSDVDVLVEFHQPIGIRFIDLADELEIILKKKVDLICGKDLNPKFLKKISEDLKYV
jgi:uncharacterized protein